MNSEPPPLQVLGPAVLLQGIALRDARALVAAGIEYTRRVDSYDPPRRVLLLLDALTRAMSACPATDVRESTDLSSSDQTTPLTAKEVAVRLGISARQVRRLATGLGARRVAGGAWTFEQTAVDAALQQRDQLKETA